MKIDHLLEALDEALAALVIEELHDAPSGYQFSHSLIQETLYSELPSIRRAQLHASIAGALEEQYGLDSPTHASELAYHFARGEAVIGTRKSVSYSLLAGEHALESYAWEEALRNFQLGLKAKGVEVSGLISAPDQVSADLLFGLGRAQVARAQSSQSKDAMNSFKPAFNQYVSSGDVERAVAIAVYPMPLIAGYVTGTGRLIEQALGLVPEDSLQAGRLKASYGRVKGLEDADYEAASQAFGVALDIARKNGDADLELQTLSYACDVDGYHIKMSEALDKGLRAVELSSSIDNPRAELMARLWCFFSLAMTGDLKNATEHAMSMLPLWGRLRHPEYASRGLLTAAMASYYAGDFDTAREFSDQGLAVAPRDPRLLSAKVLVEYELGNFDEGRTYLARFVEVATQSVPGPNAERGLLAATIPAVISISGIDDYTPLVEQTCRLILDSESSTPGIIGFARIGVGLLSVLGEDATTAASHYTELAELPAKEFALITGFPPDRLLGLVASAAGRFEQAGSDFEDSLNFCRLGGYRPALAWTCHDYAKVLLHSSARSGSTQEETRIKVMSLLNEASSISGELRMRPLSERVAELEKLATEQLGPVPTFPDRLTGREAEVLRFIATGLSNREIAAELVLSARTVERHITNIYGKIKARGRADATSYALRHELLDGN
jgi:DNA-binding CsgD family transcriptional regulator/tetratricopeptide (TPR) repeat protein